MAPLIDIEAPGFQFPLDGPVLPARGRVESEQPVQGALRVAVLSERAAEVEAAQDAVDLVDAGQARA